MTVGMHENYLIDPNHLALAPRGSGEISRLALRESYGQRRLFANVTMNLHTREHGDLFGRYIERRWRYFSDLPFIQAQLLYQAVTTIFWAALSIATLFQVKFTKQQFKVTINTLGWDVRAFGNTLLGIAFPTQIEDKLFDRYKRGASQLSQRVLKDVHRDPVKVDPNHLAFVSPRTSRIQALALRYSTSEREIFAVAEMNQYSLQKGSWFDRHIVTRVRALHAGLLGYLRTSWMVNKVVLLALVNTFTLFVFAGMRDRLWIAFAELSITAKAVGDALIAAAAPRVMVERFSEDFHQGAHHLPQLSLRMPTR